MKFTNALERLMQDFNYKNENNGETLYEGDQLEVDNANLDYAIVSRKCDLC